MTRFARHLGLITLVGLVVRVVYAFVRRDVELWGDAYFYGESARLIAEGHGWINPLHFEVFGEAQQAADHPPLYLLYLAGWALLGLDTPLQQMLVSAPIGAATIAVVGLAGRRIAGARVGLVAAALAAVYPNVWSWDGLVLSETVAILAVSVVVLLAYRYLDEPSTIGVVALGAAVGFAALSRSELLLLSVLVVVPAVLGRARRDWLRRVPRLAVAGAACVVVLAPWVAFNLSRFDEPVLLSAGFEVTLSSATCDETYYGKDTGYWSIDCPIGALEAEGLTLANSEQPERSAALFADARRYISEHRSRLPAVVLARWGRISGLYRPIQQAHFDNYPEGRELPVAFAGMASWYALAGLGIAGAVQLRRRGRPVYPLLAPLGVVWFAVTVTFATNRYRASAETVVCLLAAVGIDAAWRLWERLKDDPDDLVLADVTDAGPAAVAAEEVRTPAGAAPGPAAPAR